MSNQPPYHVDQQAIHAAQIAKRGESYWHGRSPRRPGIVIALLFSGACWALGIAVAVYSAGQLISRLIK